MFLKNNGSSYLSLNFKIPTKDKTTGGMELSRYSRGRERGRPPPAKPRTFTKSFNFESKDFEEVQLNIEANVVPR